MTILAKNAAPKLTRLSSYLNGEKLFKEAEEIKRLIKESIFVPEREGNEIKYRIHQSQVGQTLEEVIDEEYRYLINSHNREDSYRIILELINFLNNSSFEEDTIAPGEIKLPIYSHVFWSGGVGSFIYALKITYKEKDDTEEKNNAEKISYYIGETTNIYKRFAEHRYLFKRKEYEGTPSSFIDYKLIVHDEIIQDVNQGLPTRGDDPPGDIHRGSEYIYELYKKKNIQRIELEYVEPLEEKFSYFENKTYRQLKEKELFFKFHKKYASKHDVRGSYWSQINAPSPNEEREDYKEVDFILQNDTLLQSAVRYSYISDEDLFDETKRGVLYTPKDEEKLSEDGMDYIRSNLTLPNIYLGEIEELTFAKLKAGPELFRNIVNAYIDKYKWMRMSQLLHALESIPEYENQMLSFRVVDNVENLEAYLEETGRSYIARGRELSQQLFGTTPDETVSWDRMDAATKQCIKAIYYRALNKLVRGKGRGLLKDMTKNKVYSLIIDIHGEDQQINLYEKLPQDTIKKTWIAKQMEANCGEVLWDQLIPDEGIEINKLFPREVFWSFFISKDLKKNISEKDATNIYEYLLLKESLDLSESGKDEFSRIITSHYGEGYSGDWINKLFDLCQEFIGSSQNNIEESQRIYNLYKNKILSEEKRKEYEIKLNAFIEKFTEIIEISNLGLDKDYDHMLRHQQAKQSPGAKTESDSAQKISDLIGAAKLYFKENSDPGDVEDDFNKLKKQVFIGKRTEFKNVYIKYIVCSISRYLNENNNEDNLFESEEAKEEEEPEEEGEEEEENLDTEYDHEDDSNKQDVNSPKERAKKIFDYLCESDVLKDDREKAEKELEKATKTYADTKNKNDTKSKNQNRNASRNIRRFESILKLIKLKNCDSITISNLIIISEASERFNQLKKFALIAKS